MGGGALPGGVLTEEGNVPAAHAGSRPLRVAHLNDIAWVGSELVAALRRAGVEAQLVSPARPGAHGPGPVRGLLLPTRLLSLAVGAARARGLHPDVHHLHFARHGWVAPLLGGPYVLHCHGTDVRGTAPGSGWGRVVSAAMRGAAAVLYSTPDLAPWVAAYRPDGAFLPNPVDVSPPLPPPEPVADILVGVRLDPIKRPDLIAASLAEVLRLRPSTTVTLIDHGLQVDEVRRALGDAARVVPPVPHAAMKTLLLGHRAAVGWMGMGVMGNFELEAMAAALPTVAQFDYPDAYPAPPPLVDAADPRRAASALVDLLEDEPARAAWGAAGRAWVTQHHDPGRIAEQLVDVYASVLAARR